MRWNRMQAYQPERTLDDSSVAATRDGAQRRGSSTTTGISRDVLWYQSGCVGEPPLEAMIT
jgi:hypothetical protein